MELIRNIIENEFGKMEGEVYFGYIDEYIQLIFKKEVPIEYVYKTAEKLNELNDDVMYELCKYSLAYYRDTIDCYPDIEEDIDMRDVNEVMEIMNHMEFGTLVVNLPEDMSDVGLNLEGSCEWESDSNIQWLFKDEHFVYVGPWRYQNIWRAKYKDAFVNYASVEDEE